MEKLHIQPSELDMLPFYEYEYTIEMYNDIMKERNDKEEKNTEDYENKYNMNSMKNQMKKSVPSYKMPSVPKISIPKF
jgi:hypothetical protein